MRQHATVGEIRIGGSRVALVVPTTYMNDSGNAVAPLVRRFGIEGDLLRLVVVHDELDLPPGRLQVKVGGGTAGHNGLRSVQSHLHSADFLRVRIGVGKPPSAAAGADHVLRRPSRRDARRHRGLRRAGGRRGRGDRDRRGGGGDEPVQRGRPR